MNGLYDELRIALHGVWNRRWLALAVAWGICLLGWIGVSFVPNSYESRARVSVQMSAILSDKAGISPADQRRTLDRLQQTLVSSVNLEKVVRSTDAGLGADTPAEVAARVTTLSTRIEVSSDADNIFEISARQPSPRLARDVTQKLIDIFQEENIAGGRDDTRDTLKFLDAQLQERRLALQAADQKRVDFETKNVGLLPGIGSPSQRIEGARAELSQIEGQLISARSALAALNGQLAGTPASLGTAGGGNPALAQAMSELAAGRARGWTESHPDMIALRSQIAILRSQSGGAGGYATPNPAYSSLQSMRSERQAAVVALEARKRGLESDMAAMSARQTSEPTVAAEQERISRDIDVLKSQYDKMLADREEVNLRSQAESDGNAIRFEVLDPPSADRVPVAPNRPLLLALVLIAGLLGGTGAAFAMGQMRTSYPTAAKLERASGLPVLGSIPLLLTGSAREERQRKLKLFYGGVGALGMLFAIMMVAEFIRRGTAA